jgi:DMSO/TMAO reductase YedYZ molybdopterin-dependent catalytic subunit
VDLYRIVLVCCRNHHRNSLFWSTDATDQDNSELVIQDVVIILSNRKASILFAFNAGAWGGLVALIFEFIVRLGGFAAFAPETSTEAFIGIVPASLEQPMIQAFGDTSGLLGLAVASIIAVIIYGFFGIIFNKFFLPRISRYTRLTVAEQFLLYAFVPWLFFGLVVFPLSGASWFGIASTVFSPYSNILFPSVLLLSQFIYALVMAYSYKSAGLVQLPAWRNHGSKQEEGGAIMSRDRRTFIERTSIFIVGAALALTSIGVIISEASASGGTGGARAGMSYELSELPPSSIFKDSRLASLVDSEITSNYNFYRVAIDIFDPSVNPNTWKLVLNSGGSSKSYTLDELKSLRGGVTEYSTFECVSNLVNGNLISNALWGGISIVDLLHDAGLQTSGVQYVVFTSVDGYTVGIPISKAMESECILAYQMNGVDLPQEHGFPLRAVIPGLYGMMSAKWITRIDLVDSTYSGFWQTRGYSPYALVNTMAFMITPSDGASVSLSQNGGSVLLGGFAFAGDRGISKVELSFDQGVTWQAATLKDPISMLTWRLWALEWQQPKAGSYQVYARATDGQGNLQTSAEASPYPSGATGYAMISLNVTS